MKKFLIVFYKSGAQLETSNYKPLQTQGGKGNLFIKREICKLLENHHSSTLLNKSLLDPTQLERLAPTLDQRFCSMIFGFSSI